MVDVCDPTVAAAAKGPPTPRYAALAAERLRWRTQLLDGLALALAPPISIAALAVLASGAFPPSLSAIGLVSATAMILAAFKRPSAMAARACVFLFSFQSVATAVVVLHGWAPNAILGMATACAMATLLLGRRWGLGLVALSLVTIAGVAALHHWHIDVRSARWTDGFDSSRASNAVRVGAYFIVCSAGLVLAISYLIDRSERALVDREEALALVERQSAAEAQLRRELEAREAALRQARELEVLGRLAGIVAHDFNNALLLIQASADFASSNRMNVPDALDQIRAAVAQASATSRQLRTFAPQPARPPRPLSIVESVACAGELLKRVVPSGVCLNVTTEHVPDVFADEGQLHRALTNLTLNACDAMPEGGRLDIRVRAARPDEVAAAELPPRGYVALEVEDTGTGMSPETMRRVFEPYFTTKGDAGTGLGLPSVQELLQALGGRVLVESALGRGSKFTSYWPAYDNAEWAPVPRLASDAHRAVRSGAGTP
jgi:signal transduction histidine kinase